MIADIYQSKDIDDCIQKLVISKHRQDFKHEVFLILCQIPCEEVIKMNGTFRYYVVRIILNLARQKFNVYHRTYLNSQVVYDTDKLKYESSNPAEINTMAERAEREAKELEQVRRIINIDIEMGKDDFPVYWATVKALVHCGSYRKLEEETGIPIATAHRTIQKVREKDVVVIRVGTFEDSEQVLKDYTFVGLLKIAYNLTGNINT